MLRLSECQDKAHQVGVKTAVLAAARAQGLPVADGLLILPSDVLDEYDEELIVALRRLSPGPFIVRSSALSEDLPLQSAAGLFLSEPHQPLCTIRESIQRVRASGQSSRVVSCLQTPVPVAVLIQPQLAVARYGLAHVAGEGSVTFEERAGDEPEWGRAHGVDKNPHDWPQMKRGIEVFQTILSQKEILIEYALDDSGMLWFLQARPVPLAAHGHSSVMWRAPSNKTYHFDRSHNPDPLSRAQIEIVSLVATIKEVGFTQFVQHGYLFYAMDAAPVLAARKVELSEAFQSIEHELLLAEQKQADDIDLEKALSIYAKLYRRYFIEVTAMIQCIKTQLSGFLQRELNESLVDHPYLFSSEGHRTAKRVKALQSVGFTPSLLDEYMKEYGFFSPAFDVAVRCDEESPEQVMSWARALAAHIENDVRSAEDPMTTLLPRLSAEAKTELLDLLPAVQKAAEISENDDALFFRLQRLVRTALLRLGTKMQQEGRLQSVDQVFHLPFALLLDAKNQDVLTEVAQNDQTQRQMQRGLYPPLRFEDGVPVWPPPLGAILRGRGVAPLQSSPVRGRAQVIQSLDQFPDFIEPGTVLVLPALIPSWAPWMFESLALVTDSGGVLSHGAVLARERGIPAVLDTYTATRQIKDGQDVIVDARQGIVYFDEV